MSSQANIVKLYLFCRALRKKVLIEVRMNLLDFVAGCYVSSVIEELVKQTAHVYNVDWRLRFQRTITQPPNTQAKKLFRCYCYGALCNKAFFLNYSLFLSISLILN